MTPGHVMLLLAAAHLVAAMSPGPNTVLVVQTALRDRRLGLVTAAGFWPAGAFWSAAGLAGIGGLIAAAPWLGTSLRLCCGLYLIHLGASALRRSFGPPAIAAPPSLSAWPKALRDGFLTNIANPKSIAYYVSIFAATGAFGLPPLLRVAAVLMLPTIGLLWYGSLVLLLSSGPVRRGFKDMARWLDRVAGAAMILFGCKLLSAR